MVAGEWPARAVGAMHAGGQADDQQPRMRVAEGRHGAGEIAGMGAADFGQETGKARADGAFFEHSARIPYAPRAC